MADSTGEDCGLEEQYPSVERARSTQHCPASDSLPEWRSSEQLENGTPSTSPPYWDTDDDDDLGTRPSDLFGKYTWKIDEFSQINKRELRSSIFEIGGYKWYILIYPQGCDVCNHLSLFLCVANHDKLLPGWSHFAQFTIAVVNKDSKKSKYSDTLHRFWKKEHDWGWKKFMELSKISDGFLVDDALVIKAQVQVIREKTNRPFRCLDWQYRRELVRVYLSNVEQLCRRFVEEKRGKFSKLLEDKVRWSSFHAFWVGVDQNARRRMSREKLETILKIVVKHFFIENEVTSTLVMDYLFSGLKVLEWQSKGIKGIDKLLEIEEMPAPFIHVEKDFFVLTDDVLLLLQRAALEPLPPKDEKGSQNQNRTKESSCGEEFSKDYIERDEKRLTELGRRTVEIFALNHIFSRIEVAYQEAVALRRQEELIREEEAAGQAENELKSKRNAAEKEKRTKKKQAKQRKGSRKGKDRGHDEKQDAISLECQVQDTSTEAVIEELTENPVLPVPDKTKGMVVADDTPQTLQSDLEEPEASPISWDTDASKFQPPVAIVNNELQKDQGDNKNLFAMDDSSSTCSTDSVPSIVVNGRSKGTAYSNCNSSSSHSREKNQRNKGMKDWSDSAYDHTDKLQADSNTSDTICLSDVTGSTECKPESEASVPSNDEVQHVDPHVKEAPVSPREKVDADGPFKLVMSGRSSFPTSPMRTSTCQQSKQSSTGQNIATDPVTSRGSSTSKSQAEKLAPLVSKSPSISKREAKSAVDTKINTSLQISVDSRPSSAPLVPALRPATPIISMAPVLPTLSRSVSAAGRLGVDPSSSTQSNGVQSYRNAIVSGRNTAGASTPSFAPHTLPSSSSQTPAFSRSPPSTVSSSPSVASPAPARPLQKSATIEKGPGRHGLTFGSMNPEALQPRCLWTEEPLQAEGTSGGNYHSLVYDSMGPYFSGSSHRSPNRVPPTLPVHLMQGGSGVTQDEFPHLDIINDLLNEEQSSGEMSTSDNYYHHHHHHHPHHQHQRRHTLNQQYPFTDDASTSFDQLDQYYEDQVQRMYGGSSLDGRRALTSQLDLSAYVNGQMGGVAQNRWPLGVSDHPVLGLGSAEANGYPYHVPDYSNLAGGLNGYNMYRPANGH